MTVTIKLDYEGEKITVTADPKRLVHDEPVPTDINEVIAFIAMHECLKELMLDDEQTLRNKMLKILGRQNGKI
jgi:hypothetical protein